MEYLGILKIGLKRKREYDFHTLEALFAGMISRLDSVSDFLSIFEISDVFRTPFGECFGTNLLKK